MTRTKTWAGTTKMAGRHEVLAALLDWRFVGALAFALLVTLSAAYTYSGAVNEHRAIDAAKAASNDAQARSALASRRVDGLLAQINDLRIQMDSNDAVAASDRSRLEAQIEALVAQVQALGGRPVIFSTPASRPPQSTTTTRPRATGPPQTTTTTRPSPPTTTCVHLGPVCI